MNEELQAAVSAPIVGDMPLARGDRVPDFFLRDVNGRGKFLYVEARGKPIVVMLAPKLSAPGPRNQLRGFERFGAHGEEASAHCFAITMESADALATYPELQRFPGSILIDRNQVGPQAFGVGWDTLGEGSRTYVLDPNQRVLAVFEERCDDPGGHAFEFLAGLRLFSETARPSDIAPVLMVPRAFEPDFCAHLINVFHEGGCRETGIATVSEGKAEQRVYHALKKRFDHPIEDAALIAEIKWRLARRVIPEIQKAFFYRVTEADGLRVACYRSKDKGYFRTHRDNDSPVLAYRRFALSLNLNTGDYEGGDLRFPEYGPNIYKPALGEAVIFSCSLLHEAMDVTAGDRFVLLGFLLGSDGVRDRDEFRRQTDASELDR